MGGVCCKGEIKYMFFTLHLMGKKKKKTQPHSNTFPSFLNVNEQHTQEEPVHFFRV